VSRGISKILGGLIGLFGAGGEGRLDDEDGGFDAGGGRSLGIGEGVAEGLEGAVEEGVGFFATQDGAVVLGVGKGAVEFGITAAPIGDGIAVGAGCCGGFGEVGAAGQGVEDL